MNYIFYDQNQIPHTLSGEDDFRKYLKTGQLGKKRLLFNTKTQKLERAAENKDFERMSRIHKKEPAETVKQKTVRPKSRPVSTAKSNKAPSKKPAITIIAVALLICILGLIISIFLAVDDGSVAYSVSESSSANNFADSRYYYETGDLVDLLRENGTKNYDLSPFLNFFEKHEKAFDNELKNANKVIVDSQNFFFDVNKMIGQQNLMIRMQKAKLIINKLQRLQRNVKKLEKKAQKDIKALYLPIEIESGFKKYAEHKLDRAYLNLNEAIKYKISFFNALYDLYKHLTVVQGTYKIKDRQLLFDTNKELNAYNKYYSILVDVENKSAKWEEEINKNGFFESGDLKTVLKSVK